MKIYAIKGEYLKQCSYLLVFGDKSILIDCGVTLDVLHGFMQENSISTQLVAVFVTHCHFDHTFGVKELRDSGVKVYANCNTPFMLIKKYDLSRFAYQISGTKIPFAPFEVDELIEGDGVIDLGFCKVEALYTAGHSLDGMCYYIDGLLFTGDVICTPDDYGRFDFKTGDMNVLKESLRKIYNRFSPDVKILTGHDYALRVSGEYNPRYTLGYTSLIKEFAFYEG